VKRETTVGEEQSCNTKRKGKWATRSIRGWKGWILLSSSNLPGGKYLHLRLQTNDGKGGGVDGMKKKKEGGRRTEMKVCAHTPMFGLRGLPASPPSTETHRTLDGFCSGLEDREGRKDVDASFLSSNRA